MQEALKVVADPWEDKKGPNAKFEKWFEKDMAST